MPNQIIDNQLLSNLRQEAVTSPRKRTHHLLHLTANDPVQRMVIALHKDTYIRPHIHRQENKWELLALLDGEVLVCLFDKQGNLTEKHLMSQQTQTLALEISANQFHNLICLSPNAQIIEVKEGPYTPFSPEDFASWSPPDKNVEKIRSFNTWCSKAKIGDSWSN